MKRVLFILAVGLAGGLWAATYSAKSPDGLNEIRLDTEPALRVTIFRCGLPRAEVRNIALDVADRGVLGGTGCAAKGARKVKRDAVIPTPVYKRARIKDNGAGTVVSFGDWSVELHARNDGVAYRFATAWNDPLVKVTGEAADITFPCGDLTVYAGLTGSHQSSWESIYTKTTVANLKDEMAKEKQRLCYLPLLVQYKDGANMCVTESDLLDYPGWNLVADASVPKLNASFAHFPDPAKITDNQRQRHINGRLPYLAQTRGARAYPWRVFVLADRPTKLVEADIVYALAAPSKLTGDLSWVKPGKVAWDWWNNWNVSGVPFRAGCNTETYKYYIDFAAKTGVEYVIFDEGWSVKLKIMEINTEVDVPELVKYANARGVGIILWCSWPQLVGRQHEVFQKYAGMGVKGFKIDFMDRDDQFVVDFLEQTARIAAEYRLMVDYHGMYKPTGFSRTYPNIINYEGVHGLETAKFLESFNMPANDLKVVFTRMVAGPLDYTPGAMRYRARPLGDDGWKKVFNPDTAKFQPNWNQPDVQGTRVHQMALMSLYEAPLQMLCDSPSQYLANMECFTFMAAVPTTWDETRGLVGDVDRVAAVARRKGDVWYVSAIASWDGAEIEIDTSFLGAGEWEAEIFSDGPNAGYAPSDYRRKVRGVTPGKKLKAVLAPGGGWTARIAHPKSWSEKLQFWK
ncbi:MAG: glycoside hydrolase family 97 catalytic domain-containing protein [Kiritimatiellae bacterium]|nr:glycoside hydrolase family 97 catalytic domain-containing protein [Kiritimatiellia bacterium]